jgi:hypothetical protein
VPISSGLNNPGYLAVSGGYLYEADYGTNSILRFDLTTVPFEFAPTLGISMLGCLWVGKRLINRKSARNKVCNYSDTKDSILRK